MQTTITGKIEEIQELKHKGPNKDFKVQNVIVEVDNSYEKMERQFIEHSL